MIFLLFINSIDFRQFKLSTAESRESLRTLGSRQDLTQVMVIMIMIMVMVIMIRSLWWRHDSGDHDQRDDGGDYLTKVILLNNHNDQIKDVDLTSNAGGGEGERSSWKELEQVHFSP